MKVHVHWVNLMKSQIKQKNYFEGKDEKAKDSLF